MKKFNKSAIIEIICSLFILLFVYTAVTKLVEHNNFKAVIARSSLIGIYSNILSWLIPVLELITATFLFISSLKTWGLACALFLMIVFSIYILYLLFVAEDPPCSCGGVLEYMTWKQHLLFNIFFIILSAAGLRLQLKNNSFIAIKQVKLKT